MKHIKICFLVSSLCNEGPVNVMYNIIKYMDFTRFEVGIVTLVPEKKTTRMKDFQALPIQIVQNCPDKSVNPLKLFWRLKRAVNALNPEILHAHCPRSLYLMYFLPKRFKKTFTIHNYPNELQRILYGKWKGNIVIWLDHLFTNLIDCPICCSLNIQEDYLREKGWNFMCVPNGTSMHLWQHNEEKKKQLRKEFSLKDGVKYFIFISRFSQEKNPDLLVKVFQKLNRKDIGFVMLGDGPMWGELKKEETENIILQGFTTRIYDYIIASDYYISASNTEGLANTLLESMSVGLPMMLSDIPSHRTVMGLMKGNVGYLYNQHNEKEMIDTIEKITAIDNVEAAKEIQQVFCNNFTAEMMSQGYQDVYIRLIEK